MRTVVVAADPVIEALMGDLVEFAGHRPLCCAGQRAPEAIEDWVPDAVLLDASLPRAVLNACTAAAAVSGATTVYFASQLTGGELRDFARAENSAWFALPNGPSALAELLERTVPITTAREPEVERAYANGPHPAVVAAAAANGRAQHLTREAARLLEQNRSLRQHHEDVLASCRASRAQLRTAVMEYAVELRHAGVSVQRAQQIVQSSIHRCTERTLDRIDAEDLRVDAVRWCAEAYAAA